MIVVMKPGASRDQVQHVVDLVRDFGLKDHVIEGTDRTVVACIGDKRNVDHGAVENAAMVERIVPILAPYKMASTEVRQQKSVVKIGPEGFPIGGTKVGLIAGPCSVETQEGLLEVARQVKQAGGIGLRGGAFKPRSSPYSFQGLGEEGLKMLAAAREETGLAVVTEVIGLEQVDIVARYADVLQIGARNMQHYPLLEAVGKQNKPVLLKRGMSATLEEWLLAAEYIINEGNEQVILCERGIRTFESFGRNTMSAGVIAALNQRTHLPVIADPSHSTGHSYLVESVSLAMIAAGADGLMIECHHDPEHAMCDGAQSITPGALKVLIEKACKVAMALGRE